MAEIFMRMTKEYAVKFLNDDFVANHKVTPEEAQVARAMVEQNQMIISEYIFKGYIDLYRVDDILRNEVFVEKYVSMWEALQTNDNNSFKQMFDDIKVKADVYCGWLAFYNECLQDDLQLNLVPMSRDDYNYADYLDGGPSFY